MAPGPAGEDAQDEALDALRFARAARPARRATRAAVLRAPGGVLAILASRLAGKRLRARQAWAALAGIDHRLAVPPARVPAPDAARLAEHGLARLTDGAPPAAPLALLLPDDHALTAGAAAAIAAAFAESGVQALYGDALVRLDGGWLPLLRPAFDPDYLRALDYAGPVVALRRAALDRIGHDLEPGAPALDALLRIDVAFGPGAVRHLPRVLSLWRPASIGADLDGHPRPELRSEAEPRRPGPEGAAIPGARLRGRRLAPSPRDEGGEGRSGGQTPRAARLAAVRRDLDRRGEGAARLEIARGVVQVLRPLPAPPPRVSLIVPTRDRLDLLRVCLDSLIARTDWPDKEILVCDNDSRAPETHAYLRDLAARGLARTIPCPGPFDFAAMNNAAAAQAQGTVLAFVNNDVEAFRPDWLGRMTREALRPEVGAVGAKLVDAAGRIQHGGVVLGTGGLVTHGHRHFPGEAPGYLGALEATHRVSAVTAACLVVERGKFAAVGGFDAGRFRVDFNDVDLCLRLDAAGFRSLLVPAAVLHHREAASRRRTPESAARHAAEVAALNERWGPLLAQDPHYHPGFDPGLSTHARLKPDWTGLEPATPR